MKILAVIPARGGSKRLPRKNVLDLFGKPLIQWTIDAALKSPYINVVMVSTDCSEIEKIAKNGGAEVPFLRNSHLSNDTASSEDVVLNAIEYYNKKGECFDAVLLLQPTSPLRTTKDITNAVKLYKSKKANAVVSVTECEHSPLWCNKLPSDLNMDSFIDESIKSLRSQDLPKYYRLNGAIFLISTKIFMDKKTFMPMNTYSLVMEQDNSVDIDTKIDFILAEAILKMNHEQIF